jgi:hypothetical protein
MITSQIRGQWIGVLALVLVLGGGGAYAAFDPVAGDGDVDACYAKRSGDLDLRKGHKCDRGERPVAWARRGPEGPPGVRGGPGPVGPTFATTLQDGGPAPPANPDTAVLNAQYKHTFVTPSRGRLLVFASLRSLAVRCTVGNGNAFLYLDGVGVPGSGQVQPDVPDPDPFTPIALTGVVPAGEHTLTIALDCPLGNRSGDTGAGDGDLGAVLIGG